MDYQNSYGKFVEDGRGFAITTPNTPSAWVNYLYNDSYHCDIDQVLGGVSRFVKNYTQTTFTDGKRLFYVRDRKSGKYWQVNSREHEDGYTCYHYLNSTVLEKTFDGITVSIRIFVPVSDIAEYWTVTLTNNGEQARSLSLFTSIGFPDSSSMGGTCAYENGVIHKYSFPHHVYHHEKAKAEQMRARYFITSDSKPASCDMSGYRYFGNYMCSGTPIAVKNDTCSNIVGEVESFVGAMQHTFELTPGESRSVSFAVGAAVTKEEMFALADKMTPAFVEEQKMLSDEHWSKLTASFSIKTPNNGFNALVNYWFKKQSSLLTRLNRMGTYCPIRNQLQDAMGYSVVDPQGAIPFMMTVLKRQEKSGYVKQWNMTDGSAPTKLCLLEHCDGAVWLVLCITELINQNGDLSLCDMVIPYRDGGEDTIYHHLLAAIDYMCSDVGAHGLCLMRDGDWTDPINGIGREGRGESTWTTVASMYCIKQFEKLCEAKGDAEAIKKLHAIWTRLDTAVNETAWNGDRYIGGYDDQGVPFADTNDSNRILLNAQSWAILAGAARGERLEACVRAIDSLKAPFGTYLLYPPFFDWDERWGRISLKKAGTTENGAVYCHATMFKAYSDAVRGDGERLYDSLLATTPINPANPVEINRQLPLFIPNYYYSLEGSVNYGRSSCRYGTGSVAWFLMLSVEHLMGVKATVHGLSVNPVMPAAWDNVECCRAFRNATYHVTIKRGAKTTVNGEVFEGKYLPYADGQHFEVVYGL